MKSRCVELDIMKFWGILLVVLGHITNFYTSNPLIHPVDSSELIGHFSTFVYMFHMPLFVFVSGGVYAYLSEILERKTTFLNLLRNKTKRLLLPYFVFGILMVFLMVGCGFRDNFWDYAYQGFLLSQDSRHLWFVLMLFEVFVVYWILYRCIQIVKIPKWCLLILSFIGYLIADKFPYLFQINSTMRYFFWFTLGYMFLLYQKAVIHIFYKYLLGGVILVVGFVQTLNLDIRIPFISTIVSMAGILLFYQLSCDFSIISKSRLFNIIVKNSYGIYLYHVFFIYLFFYFSSKIYIPSYLLVLIIFMFSLIFSILATELTRKVGLHVIIGERKNNGK